MSTDQTTQSRVIVVGNEKGGSGKSTVAMHVAIALMKQGHRVATIDLDTRQKTFTRYVENRRAWAEHIGRTLEIPEHQAFDETPEYRTADSDAAEARKLTETVDMLRRLYNYIVIDSPGHNTALGQVAHALADTLITPLNDSFVDLDVLGSVDPVSLGVTGISHYAQAVETARRERESRGEAPTDWVVMRNRLSMLRSRNKRSVGEGLEELSRRLGFRCVEGLAERLIFREFYPRGLTALDTIDEKTLGTRPTLSHATARMEVDNLLAALRLGGTADEAARERDAA
ncbi:MAG TPA: division plane positioning ATPase MipZ [Xanthobacteraceae bacterium]|nr:division plane positioning ATPase MipZ [Xanthobacteraceae bacterium]